MKSPTKSKNPFTSVLALLAGMGGVAWYLRGWTPVTDIACARLTEPGPDGPELLNRISAAGLRRDTSALASIQPRGGGTHGETEAREWVADQFRQSGLQRVRFERVVYPRWVGGDAGLTLRTTPAMPLYCLALNGSSATPEEGTEAFLVDVGGGQAEDYARLSGAQTSGLIHLAWGGSLHRRDICLNARKTGAVGVIVAHPDAEPVDTASGMAHLVEAGTSLVLGRLPTVAVSHPIGQRLREASQQGTPVLMTVKRRYTVGRGCNVVGEWQGRTSEYVALVAHHDAWHSGAADNAAGVAAMLSLARVWGNLDSRSRPRRTIRFISTAAEEEGLMGALADIVLRGFKVKARCRGVVSFDIVGAPGETLWSTGWPAQLRGAAVAIGRGLDYAAATGNSLGVYDGRAYGDHWPYTLLRIPGVMLAKYPYRFYHTPYDTPDRLDFEDARFHTAIGGTLAWRLANL